MAKKKTTADKQIAKAILEAQPKNIKEANNLFQTGSTSGKIKEKESVVKAKSLPVRKSSSGDIEIQAPDKVIADFIKSEENKVSAGKKQSTINEYKRTNNREENLVRQKFVSNVINTESAPKPSMPNAFEIASRRFAQKNDPYANSPYSDKSYAELTNLRKGIERDMHSGKITQAQAEKEKNTIDMWRVRSASKDELTQMLREAEEYKKHYTGVYNDAQMKQTGYSRGMFSTEIKDANEKRLSGAKGKLGNIEILIGQIKSQQGEYEAQESYDKNLVKWGKVALESGESDKYVPTENGITEYDLVNKQRNGELKKDAPVGESIKNSVLWHLTDGELKLYNTLHNIDAKEGTKKADEFIKDIEGVLKRRLSNMQTEEAYEYAQEHPILGGARSVVQNVAMGLPAAVDNVVDNITGDIDTYDDTSRILRTSQAAREGGAQYFTERFGETGGLLYNTGLSIVDNLANVLLFKGAGKAAGALISANMATSAASNAMISAADRGGNDRQILMSGVASGLAEYLFEKISIDRLLSPQNTKGIRNFVKNAFIQSGVEGSEETFTEIANIISDSLIMQGQSENARKRREYVMQGMSAEEATKKVMQESIVQVAMSAAAGAISGGVMGAGAGVINNMSRSGHMTNVGERLINNPDRLNRILQIGVENGNQEVSAYINADTTHLSARRAGKMTEGIITDALAKKGDIASIARIIGALEGRDASYLGSKESFDTARAVLHFTNETATKEDTALLERSSGAVTLLTAIEGDTKAWNNVKSEAVKDAEYRASRGFEKNMPQMTDMQEDFSSEQSTENNGTYIDVQEDVEETPHPSPDGDKQEGAETLPYSSERYDIPEGSEIVNNIVVDEHSKKVMAEKPRAYGNIIRMARHMGMNVRFVKDLTDENGKALDGLITSKGVFINADAENPSRFAATHEFGHRMKQAAPKEWAKYQEYVINKLKKESFDGEKTAYNVLYEETRNAYGKDDADYINEEIAVNYAGELFNNEEMLENFIREDKSLALRVRDWWYNVLESMGLLSEKKKAQQMWLRAYTAAAKNIKNGKVGTYSDKKAKIITMSDGSGRKYVHATQRVIKSKNPDMWESEIIDYVNKTVRKGEDVVIPFDNDESITITGRTAWKLGDKGKMPDKYYLVKGNAAGVIDEIVSISKSIKSKPPYKEHSNDFAKYGFDYRKAYLMDVDGKYYELALSVGINEEGKEAYNIGYIKRMTFPVTGSKARGSRPYGKSSSKDNVPQNVPSVNTNSMQNAAENTQEGKKSVAGTRLSEIEEKRNKQRDEEYGTFLTKNGGGLQEFRTGGDSNWLSAQWIAKRTQDNKEAAKPLSEIADIVNEELGIPVNRRKFNDNDVRGSFNPTAETIHTRARTDIVAIAHEIGHFLDKRLNLRKIEGINELTETMDRTLAALGYGEKSKKTEAIGEFVRIYLTNKESAKAIAPIFYKEFEAAAESGGYKKTLDKLAGAVNAYLSSTPKDRINLSIADNNDIRGIKQKLHDTKKQMPDIVHWFEYEMIDKFHAIANATGRVYAKTPEGRNDPYVLATNSLNSSARSAYILTKAFVNMDGEEVGMSFIDCIKPIWDKKGNIRRDNISELNRYLVLRHALEWINPKKKDGKVLKKDVEKKRVFADPTLENPEVLHREIEDMESELPQLKETAENLYQYQRNLKKYFGVDAGLLSEETSKWFDAAYPSYVPFFRETKKTVIGGMRRNFANLRAPILEATGGSELIVNPLESIINQTNRFVSAASRNAVMQALAHMADNVEGSGFIIERAGGEQQAVLKSEDENNKILENDKVNPKKFDFPEGLVDITLEEDVWKKELKNGKGYVSLMRNGEKVWYQINDERLFQAVSDMEAKQVGKFMKCCEVILNTKKVLITSNNPIFAGKNMVRDAITAYNNIDINNPFEYIGAYFKALCHVIQKDENYKRWCAMGGGHASELSSTMNDVNRALGKAMLTPGAKVINVIQHPIEAIASMNDIVESTPRLMAFEYEMKKNGDVHRAIYKADDITTNFKRGGRTAKNLNRIFMFSNAAIQGLDRTTRSFTQQDTEHARRNRIIKYAVAATFATILQQALIRRDEEKEKDYENLSAYMKRSNYVISLTDGKFLRIPTAREQDLLRVIISDSINYAFGDKEAFDGLVGFVIDAVWPWYVEMPMELERKSALDIMTDVVVNTARNTAIGTFTDFAANSNFTGSPIVPAAYEDALPEEQYNEKTSKLAVFIGKVTHNSPFKIDYVINNNLGILGTLNKSLFPMDAAQRDKSLGFKSSWIADAYYSTDVLNRIYSKRDVAETDFKRYGTGEYAAEYEKVKAAADFITQYNKAVKELPENEKRTARKNLLKIMNEWGNGGSLVTEELESLFDETGKNLFMKMPKREIRTFSGKKNLNEQEYTEMVTNYTAAFEMSLGSIIHSTEYKNMSNNEKVAAVKKAAGYAEDAAKAAVSADYELEQWEIEVINGELTLLEILARENEAAKITEIGRNMYEKTTSESYSNEAYEKDIQKYTDKENGYSYSRDEVIDAVKAAGRATPEYKKYKSDINRNFEYDKVGMSDTEIEKMESLRASASKYYADEKFLREGGNNRHLTLYDDELSEKMSLEQYLTHHAKAKTTAAMADGKENMKSEELQTYLNSTSYSTAMKATLFRAIGNKGWKNPYDGTKNP